MIIYKTHAHLVSCSSCSKSSIVLHTKSAGSGFNLLNNPINLFQNLSTTIRLSTK